MTLCTLKEPTEGELSGTLAETYASSSRSETTSCLGPVVESFGAGGLYLAHFVDLFSQEVSRVIYNYAVLILSLLILCTVGSLLRTLKGKLKTPASSLTFNQETDASHSSMGKKNSGWHVNIIAHCSRAKGITNIFVQKFTFVPVSTSDTEKETKLFLYTMQ